MGTKVSEILLVTFCKCLPSLTYTCSIFFGVHSMGWGPDVGPGLKWQDFFAGAGLKNEGRADNPTGQFSCFDVSALEAKGLYKI